MSGQWFSASRTTIKRSEGRNAVAAGAYRAGASYYDVTEHTTHDYTRKRGVVEVFVTTPEGREGVEWAHDPERLTNVMEASEKRKDAQVAHDWRIALPNALTDEERSELTHAMAQKLSDLYGVATIGNIHRPDPDGDDRNHHAHLLFSTREVLPDEKLGAKVTVITDRKTAAAEVSRYREIVSDLINEALSDAGASPEEFVSHLSYAARGIDKVPTIHLGPASSGLERRGELSDRGDINREILDARAAIEARLVWQQDVAQPEVDAAVEHDLAQRFGDDFAKPDNTPNPAGDADRQEAPEGTPEDWKDAPTGTPGDWKEASRGQGADQRPEHTFWESFAGQVRSYWERLAQLARDQSSGTPAPHPVPEPQTPHPPEPATEPPRSWLSRVVDVGRHVLHGWQRGDGIETWEGVKDAARLARDIAHGDPAPEPPGDQQRPAAPVDTAAPEKSSPQTAAKAAMNAFDRAFLEGPQTPAPESAPLSAYDRFMERFPPEAAPEPPTSGDPEPSHDPTLGPQSPRDMFEAYRRLLLQLPPDAFDLNQDPDNDPEPTPPEPDTSPDFD